mmetsp:Transcript_25386/g.71189  ORF Transcript_25386/g.71189 Transcript_25386/m.71189 type:complete len:195 (+) Transcript_25386:250-834(+)|eukprot:CAMPEP_0119130724 /NCGR_PEP_ID=MMETSP1310-20130426/8542_1 /TAXON_ID=464262 /ORGANISM="Genus nov. species nov., Strain RCC2339" /LENGTH=194 /DNA_ID=CAMNT_0007121253 /DNA_START=235 /DNA_END=819 /DNA_ORIENTATION=-
MASSAEVKCVVVGDGAVGKTSMLISYTEGKFPTEYVPTVFENYEKSVEYDGKQVSFSLWDTAGQEGYQRIRTLSYKNADVFLVCYSCDSPGSLDNLKTRWSKELKQHRCQAPIIVVGTKTDLRDSCDSPVENSKGEAMAEEIGAVAYMECSAKTTDGLQDIFEKALEIGWTAKNTSSSGGGSKKGFFSRFSKKK